MKLNFFCCDFACNKKNLIKFFAFFNEIFQKNLYVLAILKKLLKLNFTKKILLIFEF